MSHSSVAPVTLLITRRVSPARYQDFMAWIEQGKQLAASFPGYLGAGVFAPPPGSSDYQIIFRFSGDASLQRWANSAERHSWLEQGTELVLESAVREAHGLEGWFGQSAPPRWKQAVSVWVGFFPVSLVFTLLFGSYLSALPTLWRVLCSTLILTPIMVFIFIPLCNRLLKSWLQPEPYG